jgi:hypothetical protein
MRDPGNPIYGKAQRAVPQGSRHQPPSPLRVVITSLNTSSY